MWVPGKAAGARLTYPQARLVGERLVSRPGYEAAPEPAAGGPSARRKPEG
jgi:hypothetical protein